MIHQLEPYPANVQSAGHDLLAFNHDEWRRGIFRAAYSEHVGDPSWKWLIKRARVSANAYGWPATRAELVDLQHRLSRDARAADPWVVPDRPVVGGTFIAFARGESGPGHPGDRAWAAAVSWRSSEVVDSAVVAQRVPAAYEPGVLALREGPALESAVHALRVQPDVLLVDATGLDHPRGAGLAVHLGAAAGVPTIGVTHRTLVATGAMPDQLRRGDMSPVYVDGRVVGYWVCTRTGARAVVAHAAWRTGPVLAAEVVLAASSPRARTPVPLQQARRVARSERAKSGAG